MKKERKEYEQKYLSRYKEPKTKKNTGSSLYKPEIPKPKRNMKKERKEYEQKYLSRYKQPKSGVKKLSNLKHDIDAGALTLRQYINAKRKTKQDEIKKYEQKYLSRYKQPKTSVKKSTSWTQHDVALGRLTLSTHFNAKRKAKQDEISKYEKQYLSRYKQPKSQKRTSSDLYKPEIPKPKLDMKKERKEYEQKYLSRYKQPKTVVKKSTSWTQHDVALGKLALSPHFNAKRRAKQDEIREYEKQYLSRYKQPKSGVKKSSDLKHDTDIGTLTLGQYVNAKRKAKQDEIREYEQKYLSRYKQPKSEVKKSTSWTQQDVALGRLSLSPHFNAKRRAKQDEIREYEKQYLSRYKQPKSGVKKSSDLKHNTDLGTLTLRQYVNAKRKTKQDEIREYEKQYLSRYKQPKPQKRTSSDLYKPEIPKPKRDMIKERKEYEQKYLSR